MDHRLQGGQAGGWSYGPMGRNGISRDGRRGRRLDTPWKYCWGKYPGRQAKRKNHRGWRCCSSARRRPAAGSAGAWCAAAPPPGGVRQLDRLGRGAAPPPPGGVRHQEGHHGGHQAGHLDRAAVRRGLAPYHAQGGGNRFSRVWKGFRRRKPCQAEISAKFLTKCAIFSAALYEV